MNLIERLEGYDRAKLIVDNQINSEFQTEFFDINGNYYANDFGDLIIYRNNQWVDFDSNDPEFELFSITDLEAEVIQYHRQHKIYEVMDRVCLTINIHDESIHDDVLYVTAVCRFGQWVAVNHLYEFSPEKVRHATDEEVKAGKRLEVV